MRSLMLIRGGLVAALVVAALAVVSFLPGDRVSGGGPDLTGVYCLDLWFDPDQLTLVRAKGDDPLQDDVRVGKIMLRIEDGTVSDWDITAVSYTGPANPIPQGPPSAQSCAVKTDGNEMLSTVPYQPGTNTRPSAYAAYVDKGSDQNLSWVICQEQDFGGTDVWIRSEFVIIVSGTNAGKGLIHAYVNSSPPADPDDPYDTSCGIDGASFYTVLVVTQRAATKNAPQAALADDWDGDLCSDWDELDNDGNGSDGDLRDPFNPYDVYDVAISGGAPGRDGVIDLANDILGVITHYAPSGGGVYNANYDRPPDKGPNHWNRGRPDGVIDLANDILGVILQYAPAGICL